MMLGIGKEAVIFVYAGLSGIVTFSCYQILLLLRKLVLICDVLSMNQRRLLSMCVGISKIMSSYMI